MAYYAITEQSIGPSKNGGEMVTLTLYDLETRQEYRTYIDATMRNFDFWIDIISQPEKGYIVTGLKHKKSYGRYNHEILNADCEPIVIKTVPDAKKMFKKIKEQWAKEDFESTPLGRLFEGE